MIMVKWSDQSEKLIYRKYPEIHTFHVSPFFTRFIINNKESNIFVTPSIENTSSNLVSKALSVFIVYLEISEGDVPN